MIFRNRSTFVGKKIIYLVLILMLFSLIIVRSSYSASEMKRLYYKDADGDGWGVCDDYRTEVVGRYTTLICGDCNDNNPVVNPDAIEIPGNDLDENCDGVVENPKIPSYDIKKSGLESITIEASLISCSDKTYYIYYNITDGYYMNSYLIDCGSLDDDKYTKGLKCDIDGTWYLDSLNIGEFKFPLFCYYGIISLGLSKSMNEVFSTLNPYFNKISSNEDEFLYMDPLIPFKIDGTLHYLMPNSSEVFIPFVDYFISFEAISSVNISNSNDVDQDKSGFLCIYDGIKRNRIRKSFSFLPTGDVSNPCCGDDGVSEKITKYYNETSYKGAMCFKGYLMSPNYPSGDDVFFGTVLGNNLDNHLYNAMYVDEESLNVLYVKRIDLSNPNDDFNDLYPFNLLPVILISSTSDGSMSADFKLVLCNSSPVNLSSEVYSTYPNYITIYNSTYHYRINLWNIEDNKFYLIYGFNSLDLTSFIEENVANLSCVNGRWVISGTVAETSSIDNFNFSSLLPSGEMPYLFTSQDTSFSPLNLSYINDIHNGSEIFVKNDVTLKRHSDLKDFKLKEFKWYFFEPLFFDVELNKELNPFSVFFDDGIFDVDFDDSFSSGIFYDAQIVECYGLGQWFAILDKPQVYNVMFCPDLSNYSLFAFVAYNYSSLLKWQSDGDKYVLNLEPELYGVIQNVKQKYVILNSSFSNYDGTNFKVLRTDKHLLYLNASEFYADVNPEGSKYKYYSTIEMSSVKIGSSSGSVSDKDSGMEEYKIASWGKLTYSSTLNSIISTTYYDRCLDESYLYEIQCDNGQCYAELKNCNELYENHCVHDNALKETLYAKGIEVEVGNIYKFYLNCSSGRCILNDYFKVELSETCEDSCTDTDGGIKNLTKGTVTDKNLCNNWDDEKCPAVEKTDYCVSYYKLREYYCDGTNYAYVDIDCRKNNYIKVNDDHTAERHTFRCQNGRCKDHFTTSSSYYYLKCDDEYFCDGDVLKKKVYNINTTAWRCDYVSTAVIKDCNALDGYYCNGDVSEYRDYYCNASAKGCSYRVVNSTNCY